MIKYLFWGLLWSMPVAAATLPDPLPQGELVYGRLEPGERIYHRGFELKPDASGTFVFGVGRKQTEPLTFVVKKGLFSSEEITRSVQPRTWASEQIDGVPPRTIAPSAEDKKRIAREQKILDAAREKEEQTAVPRCFLWPVKGRISSTFGKQRIYNGVMKGDHSGFDIAAPTGTPVKAVADGRVQLAQDDLFYTGGTVLIEHGSGVFSGYSHLSEVSVPVGTFVQAGDVIGAVGATGRATGPHLHLTISWRSVRVDPQILLTDRCP